MMAVRYLRAKGVPLTRQHLKPSFYAQCYACAPFALFLGLGVSIAHSHVTGAHLLGSMISIFAVLAYLTAETLWFSHHLQQNVWRAMLNTARAFLIATIAAIGIGALLLFR
jgi:hypothetical protein